MATKTKTDNKLQSLKKKMEVINEMGGSANMIAIIQFLKVNGPSSVKDIQNNFEILNPKNIRRPFQKAGLKRGGESVIKVGEDYITLNISTGKSIYSVA